MIKKGALAFLLISWILHVSFSYGAAPQEGEAVRGGTLRVGLRKDITNLNPFIEQRSTNALVRSLIYEGLTEVNPSLEAVPSLAESWTISKDGKEYTFRLRKGVIFHDGKEMEAEDVKWSLETILEPKNRAFMQATLSAVTKVEALDRFLLKLTLKELFAPLLTIALSGDTIILPKGSIPAGASLTSPLPGTGPFQFIEWRERNQIILRAHKKYWQRGTPYLDEVIIRPVPSDDVRFLALRSGDVDLIEVVPYPMVNEVKKGKYPEIRLAPAPIAGFRMIKMNVEAPHFSNPKVRRAVALAVDRKAYIDGYAFGHGEPAHQVSPKGSRWYFDDVRPLEMDLARAKTLLSEAGYPKGFKAVMHATQGEEAENLLIQSMLRQIGVELEIKTGDFAQNQKSLTTGEFNLQMSGADVYPDIDRALYPNFHSELGPRRIRNRSGYKNPEVDQLLEHGRAVLDLKERRANYRRITEILLEESPHVNLAFVTRFYGLRSHVKGFATNPNGALSHIEGGIPATWLGK